MGMFVESNIPLILKKFVNHFITYASSQEKATLMVKKI